MRAICLFVSGDGVGLGSKVCYKCKKVGHVARDCTATDVEAGFSREDGDTPMLKSESELTGTSSTW